ncbi:MAG TPA: aminotransferase class III-fold pyridoxal phosphate-dependent enzyme [Acidimicrobiales bacterium]|nr:aminotransferase class III-fold pyridoxal phosphate-dependent enzyme [Acidimicrobiales bacterium]
MNSPQSAPSWVERDRRRVWHGFTQMAAYPDNRPVMVERAEGREVIDVDGRRYLDAISSLWVTTLGHRVPELDEALSEQLGRVAHSTLLGNGSTVVVELAEALAGVVPVEDPRFLFASDGAAAVEQALKMAFQYWWNLGVRSRDRYLVLGDAYHGDTVGSLSLGDGGFGTDLFDPLRFPGVVRTPGYRDPSWLSSALRALSDVGPSLAAVVLEPVVQGAAGMYVASPADVATFVGACRDAGVLVICDEVATGFGRTGAMFASSLCGVRPDIMTIGKGIAGGYLPMSATVASGPVAAAFEGEDLGARTFYHGHSFGGNALAAAVALRHLSLFDSWGVLANVAARAAELSDLLAASVAKHPAVGEVRQCGLMAGVELAPPSPGLRWGRRVCAAAVERGVLLRPLGDVVVLMPILTSTAEEIDRIVSVLAAAVEEVCTAP